VIATLSSKTNGPRVEFSKAKIAVATTTASPLPPIRDVSMLPCFIGSIPCTYLPTCNAARPCKLSCNTLPVECRLKNRPKPTEIRSYETSFTGKV